MNTVNPKAGTLKQMSSSLSKTLRNSISKFAFMLLIIAGAFGVMSFQGDSAGTNFDTNYAGKKDKAIENGKAVIDSCCVVTTRSIPTVKKAVYLNMPDRRTLMNSDYEVMHHFVVSVREALVRQMWNLPAVESVNAADNEVNSNFTLDNIGTAVLPSSTDLAKADEEMDIDFAKSAASQLSNPSSKYITIADAEMNDNFAIDNFKMEVPSNDAIAKADQDVTSDFEATMNPKISMPSADLVAKSDLGMTKMIQTEKKVKMSKALAVRK